MQPYTYENIRKSIHDWYQRELLQRAPESVRFEISKNQENVLIMDMTFDHCLAQLVVSEPDFAPYQFVALEAVTGDSQKAAQNGDCEQIYFFYDAIDMTEAEVMGELKRGLKFLMDYKPDALRNKWVSSKGRVRVGNEKVSRVIHPDDIRKVTMEALNGEFVCVDTQFQYLVVRNAEISVRVLPEMFITE